MTDPDLLGESQPAIYLTPGGFESLTRELEHLTSVKRPEIADRIRESLQHGEFSEDNNELDEVKFEQAIVESRIAELKALFGTAQRLDDELIPTDHVGFGSLASVEDLAYGDVFDVRVVSSIEADPGRDLISDESPMGTALFGHRAGDVVEFQTPDGPRRFKIQSIRR